MTRPILFLALLLPLLLAAPAEDKMASIPVLPPPLRASLPITALRSIRGTST